MKIEYYCICGAYWYGEIPGDAINLKRGWKKIHSGEGHKLCDKKTAANARRRIKNQVQE